MTLTREEEIQLGHRRGRKPVDLVASMSRPQGRDAIWLAIRALRRFTAGDLERECRVSLATIKTYLQGLCKAGFLTRSELQRRRNASGVQVFDSATYTLVKDVGVDAPRVSRKGVPVTQGAGRQAMWMAMRGLKEFSKIELEAVASTPQHKVARDEARDYIKHLAQAGYLQLVHACKPGTPARYRLIRSRNTGPKAPQIQRVQQVFDPNENRVVWPVREGA